MSDTKEPDVPSIPWHDVTFTTDGEGYIGIKPPAGRYRWRLDSEIPADQTEILRGLWFTQERPVETDKAMSEANNEEDEMVIGGIVLHQLHKRSFWQRILSDVAAACSEGLSRTTASDIEVLFQLAGPQEEDEWIKDLPGKKDFRLERTE